MLSRTVLAAVAALAVALAGCGGVANQASDPAGIVRQAMSLIQSKDVAGLQNIACAAQKDDIAKQFSGGLADLAPGMTEEQVLSAITIDTSKVVVGTPAVTGDTATVPLTGSMKITVDPEKVRPMVKAALEAQGLPGDDASVDAALALVGGISGQEIPLDDQPVTLVKEDGAWKICE